MQYTLGRESGFSFRVRGTNFEINLLGIFVRGVVNPLKMIRVVVVLMSRGSVVLNVNKLQVTCPGAAANDACHSRILTVRILLSSLGVFFNRLVLVLA
jgi:hypothetical protein